MTFNPDNWPVDYYRVKTVNVDRDGGLSIGSEEGWHFGVTAEEAAGKPIPVPGQEIILLGGLGHLIQGIIIGPITYRYRTRADAEAEQQAWLKDYEDRKQREYDENIDKWIARANALDEPFQSRIRRFESENPRDFWIDHGAYELFVVEQANKLYHIAMSRPDPVTWLDNFHTARWEQQKKLFPELDEGHSGNTFGGMVALARAVAQGKEI